MRLFVVVMAVGRNDKHNDFFCHYSIHQPVLVAYVTAPSVIRYPFKWLRMACALS